MKLVSLVVTSFMSLAVVVGSISATPQEPNYITFQGKDYPIHDDPFDDYFGRHPEKKPKTDTRRSSLWRGYVTYYEVKDGFLMLKDIRVYAGMVRRGEYFYEQMKSVLSDVVPGGKPVRIDWYSGLVQSSYGENPGDPYNGPLVYDETFEEYTLFEFENGRLNQHRNFSNLEFKAFKIRQFAAFKQTPEFESKVGDLSKGGRKREDSIEIIKDGIVDYSKRFLVN